MSSLLGKFILHTQSPSLTLLPILVSAEIHKDILLKQNRFLESSTCYWSFQYWWRFTDLLFEVVSSVKILMMPLCLSVFHLLFISAVPVCLPFLSPVGNVRRSMFFPNTSSIAESHYESLIWESCCIRLTYL